MENRNNGLAANEAALFANVIKIAVTVLFVFPLIHYTLYNREPESNSNVTDVENKTVAELIVQNNVTTATPTKEEVKVRVIVKQPSCPLSYLQVIFSEMCNELYVRKEMCTPEDVDNLEKHKIPKPIRNKSPNHEPRSTMVGYLAGGLLLTSLGAAVIEFYRAKSQPGDGGGGKGKPPLNRKCSLADLTVLKHNRRELIRRDSILEVPEDSGAGSSANSGSGSGGGGGGNATKQMGFQPPPLYRRCSFPAGRADFGYDSSYSYGPSYGTPYYYPPESSSRRSSVESRRQSIIEAGRRPSVVDTTRCMMIDGRRVSLSNDSPERTPRHWSRILHRH